MFMPISMIIACAALCCGGACFLVHRTLGKRIRTLEQDLQSFSEAMCQMAEIQMKSYRKLNGNVGAVEERILELAMPSRDTRLPLERRHKVLALSKKGVALDEIVKRLNLPKGEAELILSLRKYSDVPSPKGTGANGALKGYVQA